jgi:hypothetical protein
MSTLGAANSAVQRADARMESGGDALGHAVEAVDQLTDSLSLAMADFDEAHTSLITGVEGSVRPEVQIVLATMQGLAAQIEGMLAQVVGLHAQLDDARAEVSSVRDDMTRMVW